MIPLFSYRIHSITGNEILLSLCKILTANNDILSIFCKGEFVLLLPFKIKEFRSQLLDLLYILVQKSPDIFDSRVAELFPPLVSGDPRKCLIILSIFAHSFDTVRKPLSMLDILFLQTDEFRSIECADDYVSLLIWLLQHHDYFHKERIQHCWTYICDMLKLSNVAIVNTCYYGLCMIADIDKEQIRDTGYPVTSIVNHIQKRPLRSAAMSLLMRYPPPPDTKNMGDLLQSLLKVAEEDERATLILILLSMDETNAQILINNSQWMTLALPTPMDTMKLFCIILLHSGSRLSIMESPNIIDFFKNLLSINSVGISSTISTIMRCLPLSPDFIADLSTKGFLGAFFSSVLEHEKKESLLSALKLLDTIARIRYVRELSEMVDTIVRLIKEPNELSTAAAQVAIDMCKYPKCAKLFKSKRLHEFYKQPMNDPKMKKHAERFLQVLNKIEQN